jgi:L-threonylcarbamoyladenylate synthase
MNASAIVLPTHSPALFEAAVARAADLLRAGQVVALPTETVYGLAANGLDADAVRRIFAIKGRPVHNPIIVHVASLEMAQRCVSQWPEAAARLAAAFWPGPLTLVLPRSAEIPDVVTAGGSTVGVRWPSHPFMQAVIERCGFPLAAPSANRSTGVSPTHAAHVQRSLGTRIPLIVDGGQAQVGIESTVVDLSGLPFRVLRPGMIHAESLAAATATTGAWSESDAQSGRPGPLRSPGQLLKHYAPRARLVVWNWETDEELRSQIARRDSPLDRIQIIAHTRIPLSLPPRCVSVIPHDAEAFARALYAELHRCDDTGAELIIVEAVPEAPAWDGIRDRLRRAAG